MAEKIIRYCKKHEFTEFYITKKSGYVCKQCLTDNATVRRHNMKERAIKYKGGKCQVCGYHKFRGALEFHHVSDNKELDNFTGKSWDKLVKELDKCILLCANCHREEHNRLEKIRRQEEKDKALFKSKEKILLHHDTNSLSLRDIKTENIGVLVSKDMYNELCVVAEIKKCSISEVMREAANMYIRKCKESKPELFIETITNKQ